MTDPVALLEELAKRWRALNFEICGEQGHGDESLQMCTHDLESAIALMRAPVGGDPEKGHNDPSWRLFDRVDFALRDAGFDLDLASSIAARAEDFYGDDYAAMQAKGAK